MIVREIFTRLGLSVDAQSFAKGQLAADAVKLALSKVVDVARATAAKFQEVVKTTAEAGKEIHETAQATGLTTRALQELRGAAKATGVDVGDMDTALFKLSRSMYGAGLKGGEGAAQFARLGVRLKDSKGQLRATDSVMMDIAERFSRMPDGAQKTAQAMAIFGRSGARLIPMLNQGAAGLQKFRDGAFVMTEEQLAAGRELTMTQAKLGAVTKKLWTSAVAPLLPAINDLLKSYLKWRQEGAKVMAQRIQWFLGGVIKAIRLVGVGFKYATGVIDVALQHWKILASVLAGITAGVMFQHSAAIGAMIANYGRMGIAAVAAGAKAAAGWLAAVWPIALIAVGVAAVVVLFEDLYQAITGGDAVIKDQFAAWRLGWRTLWEDPRFAGFRTWIEGLQAQWQVVVVAFNAGLDDIGKKWDEIWSGFKAKVDAVVSAVEKVFDFIGGPGAGARAKYNAVERASGGVALEAAGNVVKARESFVGPMPRVPAGGVLAAIGDAARKGTRFASALTDRTPTEVQWTKESGGQVRVVAPEFNIDMKITPAPGMSPEQVATEVQQRIETWYRARLEEAHAAAS